MKSGDVARGAVVGLVGGLLAAGAMSLAHRILADHTSAARGSAFGLPFGLAVWLGAHAIVVPALGLADSPVRQPIGKEAEEFGLHLAYGSVTELVRRSLRG
jgi:uncharacterized membrane protein YagU involved in acid resistance